MVAQTLVGVVAQILVRGGRGGSTDFGRGGSRDSSGTQRKLALLIQVPTVSAL